MGAVVPVCVVAVAAAPAGDSESTVAVGPGEDVALLQATSASAKAANNESRSDVEVFV